MSVEAVAKSIAERQVDLSAWGKVILEEVLFRAAEALSAAGPSERAVVALEFHLTADRDRHSLEISTPGAVEGRIVTQLSMAAPDHG
jgi:hypothetical protein